MHASVAIFRCAPPWCGLQSKIAAVHSGKWPHPMHRAGLLRKTLTDRYAAEDSALRGRFNPALRAAAKRDLKGCLPAHGVELLPLIVGEDGFDFGGAIGDGGFGRVDGFAGNLGQRIDQLRLGGQFIGRLVGSLILRP